jgi:hypothetical protein
MIKSLIHGDIHMPDTIKTLNETYRYLRHMLSTQRPAESDVINAYFNLVMPIYEEAAQRNMCLVEWHQPSIYVQEIFKRLPTISQYAQHSRGAHVQSDSTIEFTIFDGRTRTERTGLLFVENGFTGHTVSSRILSQTGGFAFEGRGSLDFIMREREWPAHEALIKKAVFNLMGGRAAPSRLQKRAA